MRDRGHFFGVAARAMRRIVIDHLRTRQAIKRGGDLARADIDLDQLSAATDRESLLLIDDALTRLEDVNERLVRVAECRLFGGLTEQETADALNVSLRTVQREWPRARAWLQQALGPSVPTPPTD
jgi:RNA polymerase sigma factor (TIGR02999 family)